MQVEFFFFFFSEGKDNYFFNNNKKKKKKKKKNHKSKTELKRFLIMSFICSICNNFFSPTHSPSLPICTAVRKRFVSQYNIYLRGDGDPFIVKRRDLPTDVCSFLAFDRFSEE